MTATGRAARSCRDGAHWRSLGLAAALLVLLQGTAAAQSMAEGLPLASPLSLWLEPDTAPGIWREGGNPAGLGLAGLMEGGRVRLQLSQQDGGYRRPQRPASTAAAAAGMDGVRVAAGWTALGSFTYERRQERDVQWSVVADPYAGFPYVWADQRGGDWSRDGASLRGALGSPLLLGRMAVGAAVEYDVSQGARRSDPRPLFRRRDMKLSAGLRIDAGQADHIGVHGFGDWSGEENEIGYFAGDDPVVYLFRGYGFFSRSTLVRSVRSVDGRVLGGGVQYAHGEGRRRWSVAMNGFVADDSARVNIASPEFGGGYRRQGLEAAAAIRQLSDAMSLEATVRGASTRGEGTDPFVQPRAVNALDDNAHVLVTLAAWPGQDRAAAGWTSAVHAGVAGSSREDVFVVTDWQVRAALVGAMVGVRRRVAENAAVMLGAEAGIRQALRSDFQSARPTEMTPVLVTPDFDYHATARREGAVSAGGEMRLQAGGLMRGMMRVGVVHAPAFEAGSGRVAATLKIEVLR